MYMSVSVHICVACVHACMCVHVCAWTCIFVCMYVSTMCVDVCVYVCACLLERAINFETGQKDQASITGFSRPFLIPQRAVPGCW